MAKMLDSNGLLYLWSKIASLFQKKIEGKSLSTNDYTNEDKTKLSGIANNANNYSLPIATADILGGVKIGSGLSVENGILSSSGSGSSVTKVSELENDAGYQNESQVNTLIANKVASAVIYKGSVTNRTDLDSITNPQIGWMYNVTSTDMNYVYNGETWDAQASTISVEAITNSEIDTIVAS